MRPDMDRFVVPVLAIWLCVAASIAPADAASRPGSVVLPAAVEGWTWDGQEAHYDARTVFDYIDGAGELFLAYGFEQLAVRRFEKADQPPLTIECYRMASPRGPSACFRSSGKTRRIGIGQRSEQGGGLLRFWKGRYFVSIFADGEGAEAESAILQDKPAYHPDGCAALGKIWTLPIVKGKTRLNVLSALTPQFYGRGANFFDRRYVWPYKALIVGTDPVAVDAVGARLLQAKRIAFFGEDRALDVTPHHIQVADTEYHLGVSDLRRIEVVKLGWMEDVLI